MVMVGWTFRRTHPRRVDTMFRGFQLMSAAAFSLSHGTNDSQKTMGVVVGLLYSARATFAHHPLQFLHVTTMDRIPFWVEGWAYGAIALGTLFGGWRIVKTMGQRITKLQPYSGFCAETGGAAAIFFASHFGIPVSTTHTITGAISGVGATQRISSVRWGVAGRIVWAWILTIPMAAVMAAVTYLIAQVVVA
jgi:PiT family inorganic phosphate transporter